MEYPILNKKCRMLKWGFVTLGVERLIFGRPQTRYCFAGQFRLLSMPNHILKSSGGVVDCCFGSEFDGRSAGIG